MRTHTAAAVLGGLALTGALAGCAAPATTTGGTTSSGGPYTDGTYTESGSYQSPNGTESVDVTVTLESDVITAVEVVGHGDNPDSKRYQGEFIGGISAEVVGKDIDEVSVSRVAGSSLTSGGFMSALEAIKADAAA